MENQVSYPPQEVGEYSCVEGSVGGMIPIRAVVSKRVEGWCAYFLLKYMREDFYNAYGDNPYGTAESVDHRLRSRRPR